jgi:hypothetical protein
MRREPPDKFDPQQPALIVTYGNTKRKHRPLDREVLLLGRAPGCDLGLVAPEIAPVHCVIVRLAQGWRIRDCSGRPGTCLNGKPIHDEALRDGDVIQVGSFSFQAHLPRTALRAVIEPAPAQGASPVSPSAVAERKHLERSRRNLAHHALRLRRTLVEGAEARHEQERRGADLDRLEGRLRAQAREQEGRAARFREEKAAIAEERAELGRQADELRRQERKPAAAARPEVEAELAKLRRELGERDWQVQELSLELDEARREAKGRQAPEDFEADLAHYRQELQRERDLLDEEVRAFQKRRAELEEAARVAEAKLAEQREELARARAELEQARGGAAARPAVKEGLTGRLSSVRRMRQEISRRQTGSPAAPGKGPRSRQLRRQEGSDQPVTG